MEQVARATNMLTAHQPYENWMFDPACDLRVVRAKCASSTTVVHFTRSSRTCLGSIHWDATGKSQ